MKREYPCTPNFDIDDFIHTLTIIDEGTLVLRTVDAADDTFLVWSDGDYNGDDKLPRYNFAVVLADRTLAIRISEMTLIEAFAEYSAQLAIDNVEDTRSLALMIAYAL